MNPINKFDLGSVQVHKQAIADIVTTAVSEIEGVRLIEKNFGEKFLELMGVNQFSGIEIKFDENNEALLEVKVLVHYGLNIPDIARKIQAKIKSAIENVVDINLKEINVNIHGIERGTK